MRSATDAGMALQPSDRWVISLCVFHHHEQHQIGERQFDAKHGIDMHELALAFARKSPHWLKLAEM